MKVDLSGQRFHRLRVVEVSHQAANSKTYWRCECDCGQPSVVLASNLIRGKTQSCGCLFRERARASRIKHGATVGEHAGTKPPPEYTVWSEIKRRCLNPRNQSYPNYGGRGIAVCDAWRESFETFLQDILRDIGPRPSPTHSIDRIDNDGNYEPGNVRWATRREQTWNRRVSRLLTYQGKTMPITWWAERFGCSYQTLHNRLATGASSEAVLTELSARKMRSTPRPCDHESCLGRRVRKDGTMRSCRCRCHFVVRGVTS